MATRKSGRPRSAKKNPTYQTEQVVESALMAREIRAEDLELQATANRLAQHCPSLEKLDKIGAKLTVSLTELIVEERAKERC